METSNKERTQADPREFNLLDFKVLEIEFTAGNGVDFMVCFAADEGSQDPDADGATMDFAIPGQQTLSSVIRIPKKANARSLRTTIEIAKGESFDVRFSLQDQPLYIVEIRQGPDFHVEFKSFDIDGKLVTSLSFGRPEAASQPTEQAGRLRFFDESGGMHVESWLNHVFGGEDAEETLFEFIDDIFKHGARKDDLEDLRRALFNRTYAHDAAYRLYLRRHDIDGLTDVVKLIEGLIPKEDTDIEQKGGDA